MRTPLQEAINHKDLEQVKDLLSKKENWVRNQLIAHDDQGHLPLTNAIILCCDEISNLIKRKCEHLQLQLLNEVDNINGNTILHDVAEKAPFEMKDTVFKLMRSLKEGLNVRNKNGETPLHKAILNSSMRLYVVDWMLKHGADMNISNKDGQLPLHYAMKLKRDDVVKQFLPSNRDNSLEFYPHLRPARRHLGTMIDDVRFNGLPKPVQDSIISFLIVARRQQWPLDSSTLNIILLFITSDVPAPINLKYHDLEFTATKSEVNKLYKGIYKGNEVYINCHDSSKTHTPPHDQFTNEFSIASVIPSTYVIDFYGAVLEPKQCVVMEYHPQTLKSILKNSQISIKWENVFNLCIQLTKVLSVLHNYFDMSCFPDLLSQSFVTEQWVIKVWNIVFNMKFQNHYKAHMIRFAPEYFSGNPITLPMPASVYSLGLLFWEIVMRCIVGEYKKPFAEYIHLKFDFQIIFALSKKVRPTLPATCPSGFKELIERCWDHTPESRPSLSEILNSLYELQKIYETNTTEWNAILQK